MKKRVLINSHIWLIRIWINWFHTNCLDLVACGNHFYWHSIMTCSVKACSMRSIFYHLKNHLVCLLDRWIAKGSKTETKFGWQYIWQSPFEICQFLSKPLRKLQTLIEFYYILFFCRASVPKWKQNVWLWKRHYNSLDQACQKACSRVNIARISLLAVNFVFCVTINENI
jgi:hypothetical protein